jgi:hypothetical protein
MSAPSNSNKLTLGGPLIDPTMFRPDTDPAVVQMFMNLQAALIGMGWPSGAQSTSDATYQAVYYSGGDFYGGKPEDPLNPDLLLSAAGGTVIVQEEGVALASPTGTLNFIGASVTAVLNGAVADITVVGGSSNSFETIDCPSGTDPVASSATDVLTFTDTGAIVITGDSGSDTIDFNVQAYATIQEDASDLAQRFKLNFATGLTATDDAGNARTNVNLALVEGTYIDVSGATISVDLTEVSGYNGAATQKLQNATGTIQWTADSGGGGGNAFTVIAVSGQTNIEADSSTDTLTVADGGGINLTTTAGTDTLTIAANLRFYRTTGTISAASYNAGTAELTLGSGNAKRLTVKSGSPTVFEQAANPTVTIYNSVVDTIPSGKVVQCKLVEGLWVIDVEDCG